MSRPTAKGQIKSLKSVDQGAGSHIQLTEDFTTSLSVRPPEGVCELEYCLGYHSMLSLALAAMTQGFAVELTFDDPPVYRGTAPIIRAVMFECE